MPQRSEPFVVIAEFEVPIERSDTFPEAAGDDARHSISDESGCLQFDVSVEQGEPARVNFYEAYANKAAFDVHLQTPHLARFPVRFLERAYAGGDA